MKAQIVLIADDDAMVTESVAAALDSPHRRIILCSDIDAAAIVMDRYPLSLILTDIQMTQPYGYEGLDLTRRATALKGEAGVVVMTGLGDPELEGHVRSRGASMLLRKPFELSQLERLLEHCPDVELPIELERAPFIHRFPDLDDVIGSGFLRPAFQPIVDLGSGKVAAVESLARYRTGAPLNDIGLLLDYAERHKRIVDLDLALVSRSLEAGAVLARQVPLFVNVHPATLGQPDRFVPNLLLRAEKAGVALDRLVIEITEHAALPSQGNALDCLDELRSAGVRFALDDVGMAYSHLSQIDKIKPSFLKISQDFGTDFETDMVRSRIVRNICNLGADFGFDVVLEGVESATTANAARKLGIGFAQGYHFARPGEAGKLLNRLEAAA